MTIFLLAVLAILYFAFIVLYIFGKREKNSIQLEVGRFAYGIHWGLKTKVRTDEGVILRNIVRLGVIQLLFGATISFVVGSIEFYVMWVQA